MADPISRGTITLKDDKSYTRKLFTVWRNDNGMTNFAFSKESNEFDISFADLLAEVGIPKAAATKAAEVLKEKYFLNYRENKPRADF